MFKKYFTDNELTNIKNLIKLEIEAQKNAVEIIDKIKPVIIANDGKRADKRFTDKLQAIYKGLTIRLNSSIYGACDIDIIYYIEQDKRHTKSAGGSCHIYINNSCLWLTNNHDFKSYENGKINASEIIKTLEQMREYYGEQIKQLTTQRQHLKTIIKKWVELVEKTKEHRGGVNYTIAKYCGMYEANIL